MRDDNIVDLVAERNKREQPDPEFISQDEYGRKVYTFCVEYDFEGHQFSFHLQAYSWEDAEAKVAALRQSAKVYGQMHSVIPA
jgi:extradiol dioxygenase family protein